MRHSKVVDSPCVVFRLFSVKHKNRSYVLVVMCIHMQAEQKAGFDGSDSCVEHGQSYLILECGRGAKACNSQRTTGRGRRTLSREKKENFLFLACKCFIQSHLYIPPVLSSSHFHCSFCSFLLELPPFVVILSSIAIT